MRTSLIINKGTGKERGKGEKKKREGRKRRRDAMYSTRVLVQFTVAQHIAYY